MLHKGLNCKNVPENAKGSADIVNVLFTYLVMSETCRVLCQIKLRNSASRWLLL